MGNYLNGTGKEYCTHCNKSRTPEGHDGCIGTLKNVMNACCGHGETNMAYVQFDNENYNDEPNRLRISGQTALDYINLHKI